MKFAFAAIILLLLIWRMKRGFANGMMQEVVNLLSGIISLACVALVFLAVRSAVNKSMHVLTVCVVALVLLGIVFKLCHLILTPLLAVGDISIVSGINKLLGGIMGALEGCLLAYILYKAFAHFGIYMF